VTADEKKRVRGRHVIAAVQIIRQARLCAVPVPRMRGENSAELRKRHSNCGECRLIARLAEANRVSRKL